MVNFEELVTELEKVLHTIMMEESTVWLINSLLKAKLSTWDVFNFASKQADLRTTIKTIDWQTVRVALAAKVKDAKATLKNMRRRKSYLELEIRTNYSERGLTLKQILAKTKAKIK